MRSLLHRPLTHIYACRPPEQLDEVYALLAGDALPQRGEHGVQQLPELSRARVHDPAERQGSHACQGGRVGVLLPACLRMGLLAAVACAGGRRSSTGCEMVQAGPRT